MGWLKKEEAAVPEAPVKVPEVKVPKVPNVPFNPIKIVKRDVDCVADGCLEKKQYGQNFYCAKHVRAG